MSTTEFKEDLKKVEHDGSQELIHEYQYQKWWTLKEAAALKGVSWKTLYNKRHLMPLGGQAEGKIGGRLKWRWETIKEWLEQTDEDIERISHK